jgi:subtilase family serine protease
VHLPSAVAASVQAVTGLSTLAREHPEDAPAAAPRTSGVAQACSAATNTIPAYPGSLTIDQVLAAYGFDQVYSLGDLGQGTTVAVYELEGNFPADITAFESCFGVGTPVSYEQVDGGGGTPSVRNGDGLESELDVENLLSVVPSSHVLVYQGPNSGNGPLDVYRKMVSDDTAQSITTSWGGCESQTGAQYAQAEQTVFQEAATQGQSIFAASGDTGSEDCTDDADNVIDQLAVDDPASQPWVTGVGGTRLSFSGLTPVQITYNNGPPASDSGDLGAGGGGVSTLWSMPSYQSTGGASTGTTTVDPGSGATCGLAASAFCREVPDVAANADPISGYVIYYDGGWTVVAGTSGATPVWAGLAALADSCAAGAGGTPLGQVNYDLYPIAAAGASSAFTDITSGTNDYTGDHLQGGVHQFTASTGYDLTTGLGTPLAGGSGGLVARLCATAAPAAVPTVTSLSPASGPMTGGAVTINGSGFVGAPTVTVAGAAATNVQLVSFNQLTAVVPPGSAGGAPVVVTTAAGSSSGSPRYTYTGPSSGGGGGGSTTTTATTTTSGSSSNTATPPPPRPPSGTAVPTPTTSTSPPAPSGPAHAAISGGLAFGLRQSAHRVVIGTATCPQACNFHISLYATRTVRVGHRTTRRRVEIGVLRTDLAYASRRQLVVALNALGLSLLRASPRLPVTITVKAVAPSHVITNYTRSLTLKR